MRTALIAALTALALIVGDAFAGGTVITQPINTFSTTKRGLVPAPGSSTGKFLKDDGTWASPPSGGSSSTSFDGASAYLVTTITIPSGAYTLVYFDNEEYKTTSSYHSNTVNPSRLIAPTAGYYEIVCAVHFSVNSANRRIVQLRKNAGGIESGGFEVMKMYAQPLSSGDSKIEATKTIFLSAGDYVEAFAFQDSGGGIDLQVGLSGRTFMQLVRKGS